MDNTENLLNSAPGGMVYAELNSEGELCGLYANRGLADTLGYPDRDSCTARLTSNPFEGLSESDADAIREKISEAVALDEELGGFSETKVRHTCKCRTANDSEIWISIRARLVHTDNGGLAIYASVMDITGEKNNEDDLRVTAYFDPLTGLYNRSAFLKNAQRMLDDDPQLDFSIMKLDIANFKVINDVLGREVGDKVLKTIADVLRTLVGGNGVYARFFADNFMVMMPYSERSVHPQAILDGIQKAIAESGVLSHEIHMYIGVYRITDRSISAENMADRASIACRSISGSFREHIAYYDEKLRRSMLETQQITDESRKALQNGEFYVCYQPVYGIRAKKFVSAEALVRWNHPTKGTIPPTKFIPIFEKNGFIAELDLYVLEQVCAYQKKRRDKGLHPFPISVNVSRMSLYNPNLFSIISDLTAKYKVDPKYFRIEITESAYNDNPQQLLETVGRLRGKCYPVLMDDFGSGYSSLNTLKDIPIDILKLDMKFMQGFEKNGKVGTIVTAISRMSKWLNVPMLAEGVETKEQYDFLVSIGCSYIQGFYFSRPVPERDFTDLVEMEEVTAVDEPIESFGMGENVNELLGSNPIVSKFIGSVFGGLGIYEMVDDRLELIRVNDGYMEIMGYTTDDLNSGNINIWKNIHPDDVDISRNACLEAMRTDKAVRATVRRYSRGGELLVLDGIHRRLGGSDDHPIFCIAFNNLSEKLKSDKIIENSKSRAKEILNATGSIAWDVDFETHDVFFVGDWDYDAKMDRFETYTGEISPFSNVVHPEDADKANRFHKEQIPGKRSIELRIKNKLDDEYYWWRFTRIRYFDNDGKIRRLVGVGTNINAEKTAREELELASSGIEHAMNNLTVGILFLEMTSDDMPHIVFSNDRFWSTIGKNRTDDAGFFEVVHNGISADDLRDISEKAKHGGIRREYSFTRDDGEEVWIDFSLARSKFGSETSRMYMIVVSDITERHENRTRMDAIIRNYSGGIALINASENSTRVEFANEKFFEVLGVTRDNTKRISQMITAVFSANNDTADLRIHHEGTDRIVRIHIDKAESPRDTGSRYVVTVNDVTVQRAEIKNRIAERTANMAVGTYDAVYELNLANRTLKLAYSRKPARPDSASTPLPLSAVISEMTGKYLHPDDAAAALELFTAPLNDPDFTDLYHEIRALNVPGGEYHTYGIAAVRSKTDVCMLFIRDKARIDDSKSNEQIADMNRAYQIVAEQTHTTIIEYDYETGKVVCSPSIKEFATPALRDDGTCEHTDLLAAPSLHPDDKEKYVEFLNALKDSNERKSVTVRLQMADGTYKWCRFVISLLRNGSGQVVKSLCTINQIHEEMLARQKAEESDRMLRRTVRNIPVGVGIFRLENEKPEPIYLSDNIYTIYGLEHSKTEASVLPPVLPIEQLIKENGLYAGSEGEYAMESYRADGSKFWLGVNYRLIDEQGELILYASMSDISERIARIRHETAEEQMYHVLLSESGTVLFDYKADLDTFTYFSLDENGKRHNHEIPDLLKNPERLSLFGDADRTNFILMLNKLLITPGSSELPVRIMIDGYPRRHRIFMKSVCDTDNSVFEIVGKIEDTEDELAQLEKIKTKAMYDSLCVNLYNKATTEELIRNELDRSTGGALLMIDIDDFKAINDNLGHMFGDEFLKNFANAVKSVFRDTDIVGRYGGDEFFVFMPHVSAVLAEKKGEAILQKVTQIEVPLPKGVGSSIGIAVVNPDNRKYSQLLKQADSALYSAKNSGKNTVVVFNPATMDEGVYRTTETSRESSHTGSSSVMLSSNPADAASMFMRVFSALYSSSDINAGVNQILELVGKTYDVSRAYIFEDSEDGRYCSNTFEWCNTGVSSIKSSLQLLSYDRDLGGGYRDNMNDDGIFYCHDVAALENQSQRELFTQQGVKSILQCSITDDGKFRGFVGFDECRSNRFWTQEQIDSLVFLSHVISIFLMKDRSKNN